MKLDLNAAWDHAVRLVATNREVMLVLGGVFFFLPYVIFFLLVPVPDFAAIAEAAGENGQAAMTAAMNGFLADYWWAIVLLSLVQMVGGLAVMAVVGDPARPTVGVAMRRGLTFLPSNFAAQILTSMAIMGILFVAVLAGALTGSQTMAATLSVFAFPVIVWLLTRLSLSGAAIAIEGVANPFAAIGRSWRLTKGSGLRLVAFFLLLFAAFFVISQVLGLIVRLVTAFPNVDVATILSALLSSLIYAVMIVIAYAVLASVHRQFARAERVSVPTTHEA